MNFKKVFAAIIAGATFFAFSPVMDVLHISTPCVAEAYHQIDVDESSAWFIREKDVFGASVSVDGGRYRPRTYKLEKTTNNNKKVYFRMEDGRWVYIGLKGPGKHDYPEFESDLAKEIFIMVANYAARSQGLDHMF